MGGGRYLEGFAAGFGEAEPRGGGCRGGRHERAALHLAAARLLRRRRGGGVGARRGRRGGRHRRHQRRRGGPGVGLVDVAFQGPGHVDAEVQPQRHLGLPPSALHSSASFLFSS
jgi:hypothetical protein